MKEIMRKISRVVNMLVIGSLIIKNTDDEVRYVEASEDGFLGFSYHKGLDGYESSKFHIDPPFTKERKRAVMVLLDNLEEEIVKLKKERDVCRVSNDKLQKLRAALKEEMEKE